MEESNIWYNDTRGPKEISLESRTTVNALRRVATTVTVSSPVQRFRTIRREKVRKLAVKTTETVRVSLAENAVSYGTCEKEWKNRRKNLFTPNMYITCNEIIYQSPFAELYFPRESSVSSRSRSTNQTKR